MSGQIAIYLRNDELVVIPQGGGGGYSFDLEPVYVVKPEEIAATEAINNALHVSRTSTVQEPDKKSPALNAVKVRSWRAFYKNAAYCSLYDDRDTVYMLKWSPARDGRGFELGDDPPVPIPDLTQVGRIVLECLKSSSRMP